MVKGRLPPSVKQLVKERAKGYCEYCYAPSSFVPDFFPIDHIIPLSFNGNSELENLANACSCCNSHKFNKTHHFDPLTGNQTRLFHPRKDYWRNHFEWREDGMYIIGLTQIGRATIDLLQMNRASNINLRALLTMAGLHPPKEYPKP